MKLYHFSTSQLDVIQPRKAAQYGGGQTGVFLAVGEAGYVTWLSTLSRERGWEDVWVHEVDPETVAVYQDFGNYFDLPPKNKNKKAGVSEFRYVADWQRVEDLEACRASQVISMKPVVPTVSYHIAIPNAVTADQVRLGLNVVLPGKLDTILEDDVLYVADANRIIVNRYMEEQWKGRYRMINEDTYMMRALTVVLV